MTPRSQTKALFLDRDGTLIVDVHHGHDPDGVALLPGVREALQEAIALGYQLFLFTNQSGIGRGFFTLADAIACNQRMIELLGLGSGVFTDICIAPEHPDDPPHYRKPEPRFILESIQAHGLDPCHCYMIGDRQSDWQAGLNAGIQAVAVESGKPLTEDAETFVEKNAVARHASLAEFVASLKRVG